MLSWSPNIATALSNSVFNAVISNVPLTGKSVVLSIVILLTTTTLSSAVSPEPNVITAPVPNSYALSLDEFVAVTLYVLVVVGLALYVANDPLT